MAKSKRLIHQECHSVILWDKPFITSTTTKIRSQPFSHEIPPAPYVKPKWNYPVDPPKIRSKHYVLIEEKSKKSDDDHPSTEELSQQNYEAQFPATRVENNETITSPKINPIISSRENMMRPQSAIMNGRNTNRNDDTLIASSRPVSAPKTRLNDDFPSFRSLEMNSQRSARKSPSSSFLNKSASGIALQGSSRLVNTSHESSSSTGVSSSHLNKENPTIAFSSRPNSAVLHPSPSLDSTRPVSAHHTKSSPLPAQRSGFVPNPLFKTQKKTYFEFKRLPSTDDIFQPSTDTISGGLHAGSYAVVTEPPSEYPNPGKKGSRKMKKKKAPPTNLPKKSVVIGRSQETARIHHLIDDMMIKLSTAPTSQERIAIKQEFTQIITRFAQQPSKGGDY